MTSAYHARVAVLVLVTISCLKTESMKLMLSHNLRILAVQCACKLHILIHLFNSDRVLI